MSTMITDQLTFSTADLHDAQPDQVHVIDLDLRSFGSITCFYGQVETLRVTNHHPVREMLSTPGLGRVLVVDAGHQGFVGVMGDRLASRGVQSGWAGVVVVGAIRDSGAINALPLGVRALRTTARRSLDGMPATIGGTLVVGGINVQPGDWLYADADAVIVSSQELDVSRSAE